MRRRAHYLLIPALALAACAPGRLPSIRYDVIRTLPHDPQAFTQGLLVLDGRLLESTGLYSSSTLRELDPATGAEMRRQAMPKDLFGEGLAHHGGRLYQLTWREGVVRVYDADSLELRDQLPLSGQGWGLATWSNRLVASDGTALLRFYEPATMERTGELIVTAEDRPLARLNELEMVEDDLFANVWGDTRIARIDLRTGRVTGWLDAAPLVPESLRGHREAVLNGIAYEPATRRLFITGKNWPVLYELRLRD
jgi:glutamine cyclotransferase